MDIPSDVFNGLLHVVNELCESVKSLQQANSDLINNMHIVLAHIDDLKKRVRELEDNPSCCSKTIWN